MAIEINGLEMEVRTNGMIHRTGEYVLFTLENEKDNPKNPVLTFFTRVTPPPEQQNDQLYFCARGTVQRITFYWGPDGRVLGWSGKLIVPKESKD